MLDTLSDVYTIVAADAAAVFASRGFNVSLGQWQTLRGVNLTPRGGPVKDYRIKSVDIRCFHASQAISSGVRIWIATVTDPLRTDSFVPLVDDVQSVSHAVSWLGDAPMGAGLVWRVPLGGLIATDYVGIGVVYERG
jgi:hypothetical protein